MHDLEYKLVRLSDKVEKGTITTAKLVAMLRLLASESHNYVPTTESVKHD